VLREEETGEGREGRGEEGGREGNGNIGKACPHVASCPYAIVSILFRHIYRGFEVKQKL
jgi:hypothetical protein